MAQVSTNISFVPSESSTTGGVTKPPSQLVRFGQAVLRAWQLMTEVVNGQISFGNGSSSDNISGVWKTVTFTAPNVDQVITHNLGRVPVGYLVMAKNQAGDVYTGSVPATTTQITLKCTTTATVVLFIL